MKTLLTSLITASLLTSSQAMAKINYEQDAQTIDVVIFSNCFYMQGPDVAPFFYEVSLEDTNMDNEMHDILSTDIDEAIFAAASENPSGQISEGRRAVLLTALTNLANSLLNKNVHVHLTYEQDAAGCSTEEVSNMPEAKPAIDSYDLCFFSTMYQKYVSVSGQIVRYISGDPTIEHNKDVNFFHDLVYKNFEGFTEFHLDGRTPTQEDAQLLTDHISENLLTFNVYAASPVSDFTVSYKIVEPVTCAADHIPYPEVPMPTPMPK